MMKVYEILVWKVGEESVRSVIDYPCVGEREREKESTQLLEKYKTSNRGHSLHKTDFIPSKTLLTILLYENETSLKDNTIMHILSSGFTTTH